MERFYVLNVHQRSFQMVLKLAKGNGMVDSLSENGMVDMMSQTDNRKGIALKTLPQITFVMKVYTNEKNWRKPLKSAIQQLANDVDGGVTCYLLGDEDRKTADVIVMNMKK